MPKYFCDYCDTYLTHDSRSVRKTHITGRKHKDSVRLYYQKWMEDQAQHLIDAQAAALNAGILPPPPPTAAGGETNHLPPHLGLPPPGMPPPLGVPHLGVPPPPFGLPPPPGMPPPGMFGMPPPPPNVTFASMTSAAVGQSVAQQPGVPGLGPPTSTAAPIAPPSSLPH